MTPEIHDCEDFFLQQVLDSINYHLAKKSNQGIVIWSNKKTRSMEGYFKSYVLGVVLDDKEMRIHSMKRIREVCNGLPRLLKNFKKTYQKECSK